MGRGSQDHFRLSDCMGCSKSSELFIYLFGKIDASAGNGFNYRDYLYLFYYSLADANGLLFFWKPLKPCYIKGMGLDFSNRGDFPQTLYPT